MKRSSAKAKGKRFERRTAAEWREDGWKDADRTPNSGALARWPFDLFGTEPFGVECKADEHISVWRAVAQAEASVKDVETVTSVRFPIAEMRRTRGRGRAPERVAAMPLWVWRIIRRFLNANYEDFFEHALVSDQNRGDTS